MCKDDSMLPDMVARGTQVDPKRRPRPECVASLARATTGIGPMWPPTLFHYIPCLCIIDSAIPESTTITCPGDYCCPFCDKVLKYIEFWILPPTGS